MVHRFRIEDETEADSFLMDLLAKDENCSVSEIIVHAHRLICDNSLRIYFINKGKQILQDLAR